MFDVLSLKNDLDVVFNKKRISKEDGKLLKNYFGFISTFMGIEENELTEKYNLTEDEIKDIYEFLDKRIDYLLSKDKLRKYETQELRALYKNAKWFVIHTWTKTQRDEVKEKLKGSNIALSGFYRAPYKWTFYWP